MATARSPRGLGRKLKQIPVVEIAVRDTGIGIAPGKGSTFAVSLPLRR